MKKYILLLLFLIAVVVGPFAYQRWSEAKRLRHIRETKQTAAQIHATPLRNFLQQLEKRVITHKFASLLLLGRMPCALDSGTTNFFTFQQRIYSQEVMEDF